MAGKFDKKYPHIARWVEEHEGWIEFGYDMDSPLDSFIRALDCGGMPWEGAESYETIDEAFEDADAALGDILKELYGD